MGSVFFAAVDDEYNFPSEIRAKLSKTPELRNTIVPMSQATRDNLKTQERWNGRVIYNVNKKYMESWRSSDQIWVRYLDEETTAPPPVKPWDHKYILPTEVRNRLKLSSDFQMLVVPMSQSVRDALIGDELWDGRTIFNTTSNNHEVWFDATSSWVKFWNSKYSPPPNEWAEFTPILSLSTGETFPNETLQDGRYRQHDNVATFNFYVGIRHGYIGTLSDSDYQISIPIPRPSNGLFYVGVGTGYSFGDGGPNFDRQSFFAISSSSSQHIRFERQDYTTGDLIRIKDASNCPDYCHIEGQIVYETS